MKQQNGEVLYYPSTEERKINLEIILAIDVMDVRYKCSELIENKSLKHETIFFLDYI